MPPRHALVLTTDPAVCILNEAVAERVRTLVPAQDRNERWLVPGSAFEMVWQPQTPAEIRSVKAAATGALASHPVDVNVVPADPERRAKKLLAADMESTLIAQEMIDELAGLAGLRSEMAALTLATMRGETDFKASLTRRVAMLTGLTAPQLAAAARRITLMPGAQSLIRTMRAAGAHTAIVSGGFTLFTGQVASRLEMDSHTGNTLEIADGRLTGRIVPPILDAEAKRDRVLELAEACDIDLPQTLAVGDGANDLLMLQAAGLGVAFRAKPAVRAAMRKCPTGAVIDHADLNALLALQGLAPTL